MESTRVAVVGAGPTGLVTACALLQAGVDVRVLDRAAGPARTSRALGLQPRGVEVLDRLDALGDLPDQSLPINEVLICVNGAEVTRLNVSLPTRLVSRPGLIMSQAAIETQLRRRLRALGGSVEWGRELASAEKSDDGVVLVGPDGQRLRASWVVGCDGAHSSVRRAAEIDFPGVPLGEQFLLADVRADLDLPRTAVTTSLRGEGMLGIFPLPGDNLWRLLSPWPALGGDTRPDPDVILARLVKLLEQHFGYPAAAVRSAEWASAFHIHRRLATTYRSGRFLMAGDAAHVHSPFGGQGMNTGMGDAENLAWKLALVVSGRAGPRLLDTYEAERRPVAAEVLESTTAMTRTMLGASPLTRVLRDRVVVPLLRRPLVQRRIRDQSSQLKVTYRRGPLGQDALRPSGGPVSRPVRDLRSTRSARKGALAVPGQPGDRVADLPCSRPDGSTTRLHAELRGRWALLGGSATEVDSTVNRLGAGRVVLLAAIGGSADEPVLVRPDGHLAARGADVQPWLAAALGSTAATADPIAAGRRAG